MSMGTGGRNRGPGADASDDPEGVDLARGRPWSGLPAFLYEPRKRPLWLTPLSGIERKDHGEGRARELLDAGLQLYSITREDIKIQK